MRLTASTQTFAGYRTRVLSVEGAGPRFVLLHGYSDSARTWDGVLAEFARRGMSAVAVDMPGFGKADDLTAGPIMNQLDAFADALVKEVGMRGPVVLVGNSLGGTTSVRAGARGAGVLGIATIGDPAGGGWIPLQLAGSRWANRLGAMAVPLAAPIPSALLRRVVAVALRYLSSAKRREADLQATGRMSAFLHAQGRRAVLRQVLALAAELAPGHSEVSRTIPLLVVHGAKDHVVPVRSSRTLHRSAPGSSLHINGGWGHCPQLDDPSGLVDLLVEFADTLAIHESA